MRSRLRTLLRRSRLSAAGSSVLSCSQCAVSVRWARTVLRCWSRSSTLLSFSPLELAVLQSMSRPLNIVRPRDEEANPALNDLGSRQVRCCADLPKPPCTSSDQSSTRRNAFLGRTTTQKNRRTSCLVWSSTLQRGPQRMNDFTTVERISSWYETVLERFDEGVIYTVTRVCPSYIDSFSRIRVGRAEWHSVCRCVLCRSRSS